MICHFPMIHNEAIENGTIRIGIAGAVGRMGQMLVREVCRRDALKLTAALVAPQSTEEGMDLGDLVQGHRQQGIQATSDI